MTKPDRTEVFTIPLKHGVDLTYIGFRDPSFNREQYTKYAMEYIDNNPVGLRGGKTPVERVAKFSQLLPPGRKVFEIGPGPGHDAKELVRVGYQYIGGDIAQPFVDHLSRNGLNAFLYDAREDNFPDGTDAMYAHISAAIHINPRELAKLLAQARNSLNHERAIFISAVIGYGHERTMRTGGFDRDFYYYPPGQLGRYWQILEQEGIEVKFFERIRAFNNTATIHAGGVFKEEYKGGPGEKGLHPFGDVFYTPNSLYNGNLIFDVLDAQVRDGFLPSEVNDFIKKAPEVYELGHVSSHDMAKTMNEHWAEALTGHEISTIMQHAEDLLNQQPRFRPLTKTALAVCNNNGFSNILVGYEPSWLLEIVSKHLGMDSEVSVQWRTEPGTHYTGKIKGEMYFVQDNADPEQAVLRHQRRIQELLKSHYKRITIGVGQSLIDTGFLALTDYPIFTFPTKHSEDISNIYGFFGNSQGQVIYADSQPWFRWVALNDEAKLVMYLNMVTSNRFPVRPNRSDYIAKRTEPLWQCPNNELNPNFYKVNQNAIHILET